MAHGVRVRDVLQQKDCQIRDLRYPILAANKRGGTSQSLVMAAERAERLLANEAVSAARLVEEIGVGVFRVTERRPDNELRVCGRGIPVVTPAPHFFVECQQLQSVGIAKGVQRLLETQVLSIECSSRDCDESLVPVRNPFISNRHACSIAYERNHAR